VDVLSSPRHGGGWEEVWRSLESVEFFDVDTVTDDTLKLGSAVTVAKVGFFLEQHREELMLEDKHLERLQEHAPSQPMYFERGKRESGTLLGRWNLVVLERVLDWDLGSGGMELASEDLAREVRRGATDSPEVGGARRLSFTCHSRRAQPVGGRPARADRP
jgi:hypothetical protein